MSSRIGKAVTSEDVDAIVGLLGRIAGMTEPIVQRRRQLMESISLLVGADVWAWVHLRVPARGMPAAFRSMDGGWREENERARALEVANDPANNDLPIHWARRCLKEKRALITSVSASNEGRSKKELAKHIASSRAIGMADQIFVHYPLDDTTVSLIGLHRRTGGKPFSERDRRLVALVVGQIDWLHRAETDVPANDDQILTLTPRERQLLLLELGGVPRKQIADQCHLSTHTISDHFKSIYRKLAVRSRGELMARFIAGQID